VAAIPSVVFLCVQNAGRSQMAAAWMRALAGDAVEVTSGGSAPAPAVHEAVVETMAEVGIDLATMTPRRWTDADLANADVVVTMGCGDECPVVPGVRYLDWPVDDPSGQPPEAVRTIRDEIRDRVEGLMAELDLASLSREGA
jgi:arsenate reductase